MDRHIPCGRRTTNEIISIESDHRYIQYLHNGTRTKLLRWGFEVINEKSFEEENNIQTKVINLDE